MNLVKLWAIGAAILTSLALSSFLIFTIIISLLSEPRWQVMVRFNALGEGPIELFLIFPFAVAISLYAWFALRDVTREDFD